MSGEETPGNGIDALIEQSSLGSPGARRLRARVTPEEAESVVTLAGRLEAASDPQHDLLQSRGPVEENPAGATILEFPGLDLSASKLNVDTELLSDGGTGRPSSSEQTSAADQRSWRDGAS